nr:MAG TPA: hypothetical protein [Caudoviricetes sp.]
MLTLSTNFLKNLQIGVDIEAITCYNVFTRSTEDQNKTTPKGRRKWK